MCAFALVIGAAAAMLLAAPGLAAEKPGSAGQQSRPIKALSEEDVAALRNGDGMGLAKAAEPNGYPSPCRALDPAPELKLSDAQTREIGAIYERMRDAAQSLGAALIKREAALDRLFASGEITPDLLAAEISAIGDIQARLRAVHLLAHLETKAILGAEQVAQYNSYDKPPASAAPQQALTAISRRRLRIG
jgi:hypothetical protein